MYGPRGSVGEQDEEDPVIAERHRGLRSKSDYQKFNTAFDGKGSGSSVYWDLIAAIFLVFACVVGGYILIRLIF